MTSRQLLSDVNISDIVFPENSSKVVMTFLNMNDGEAVGAITCTGIVAFVYHSYPGGALPRYVGEIDDTLISNDEAVATLQRVGYSFTKETVNATVDAPVHHLRIEGGLSIEIICSEVELKFEA